MTDVYGYDGPHLYKVFFTRGVSGLWVAMVRFWIVDLYANPNNNKKHMTKKSSNLTFQKSSDFIISTLVEN